MGGARRVTLGWCAQGALGWWIWMGALPRALCPQEVEVAALVGLEYVPGV